MFRFLVLLVSLLAVFPAAAADKVNPVLPPGLAKAVAAYDQAQIHNDRTALKRLLADDYTLVSGAAQVEDKAQFIADSTAVGFSLKPFTVEEPTIKLWNAGAVLAGAVDLEGTSAGAPFKQRMRFADVWRKSGGKWQVVFTQVTRVPGR